MPLTRDLQFDIKPVPPSRTLTKVTDLHLLACCGRGSGGCRSDVEFSDTAENKVKTSEICSLAWQR